MCKATTFGLSQEDEVLAASRPLQFLLPWRLHLEQGARSHCSLELKPAPSHSHQLVLIPGSHRRLGGSRGHSFPFPAGRVQGGDKSTCLCNFASAGQGPPCWAAQPDTENRILPLLHPSSHPHLPTPPKKPATPVTRVLIAHHLALLPPGLPPAVP